MFAVNKVRIRFVILTNAVFTLATATPIWTVVVAWTSFEAIVKRSVTLQLAGWVAIAMKVTVGVSEHAIVGTLQRDRYVHVGTVQVECGE